MATSVDFIEFVMEQFERLPYEFYYKKMFGEYCVYANDKPILLVCDSTVYAKMLPCFENIMEEVRTGHPYNGAKLHYMLDIEDSDLIEKIIPMLEQNATLPKPRKPKAKK